MITRSVSTLALRVAAVSLLLSFPVSSTAADAARPPNVVIILADDLGFSDLGCYGSEIATPNLDALAARGVRYTNFYNCARCCPTRASLLTGLYPHQAGVGDMVGSLKPPHYSGGLLPSCITIAEALKPAGYRTYHVGKWHVGGIGGKPKAGAIANHPMDRGFDRAYGTGDGGNYFAPTSLYRDHASIKPDAEFYSTDAFTDNAVKFLTEHDAAKPFFLHLCYTAPHFPLHARPADIAKYAGKYTIGWDAIREQRFAKQQALGLFPKEAKLSPRDPEAKAWADVPTAERAEWDQRMAVYAAMIDRMDQGIGRVLATLKQLGAEQDTLVVFLSDNGASAEFMDTWPNAARGHTPGAVTGTKTSHKCLEVGWANAANTPFREHKMWVHEGGIATPFIARWPARIDGRGTLSPAVGHVCDLMPTALAVAGAKYPAEFAGRKLTPLAGLDLLDTQQPERALAWEHEGNRAIRKGSWKLVAAFQKPWELYDLAADRTELHDLAKEQPKRVTALTAEWQTWADHVGVSPWSEFPGSKYKPGPTYRKK